MDPITDALPRDPLPEGRRAPRDVDQCDCKEEKTKERKPRPPRVVCYQGTYTQRAKGIIYRRRRQVPCESFDSDDLPGVDSIQGVGRKLKSKAKRKAKKAATKFITSLFP